MRTVYQSLVLALSLFPYSSTAEILDWFEGDWYLDPETSLSKTSEPQILARNYLEENKGSVALRIRDGQILHLHQSRPTKSSYFYSENDGKMRIHFDDGRLAGLIRTELGFCLEVEVTLGHGFLNTELVYLCYRRTAAA